MRLIVMRHGEAEMPGTDDFSRHLTRRGRDAVGGNALQLAQQLDTRVKLFASPLVRAQETAGIVADVLGLPEYHTLDSLASSGDPAEISNQLEPYLTQQDCMIVSHQPCVGRLINYLAKTDVAMHTATIVSLLFEVNASGEVEWLISI